MGTRRGVNRCDYTNNLVHAHKIYGPERNLLHENIALSENSFYVRLKNGSSILRPKEDTAPLCGRLSMQPVHPYSNLGSSAWYS